MRHWGPIYRAAWIVVVLLVLIGVACMFAPRFRRLSEMQKRKTELAERLRRTEEETIALRSRQERFRTDPAFVEQVAREAGMVKPDETIFRYTNRAAGGAGGALP
jgi:cell division protein FtsB